MANTGRGHGLTALACGGAIREGRWPVRARALHVSRVRGSGTKGAVGAHTSRTEARRAFGRSVSSLAGSRRETERLRASKRGRHEPREEALWENFLLGDQCVMNLT